MDEDHKWIFCTTALSNEALAEIGRITANFSLLELHMLKLIYYLMGSHEEISLIVSTELSFSNLQALAMSLIIEHAEKARVSNNSKEKLKEILKSVSSAEQKRNTISHSAYGSKSENEIVRTKYTSKRKNGLILQREVMSYEDIQNISKYISSVTLDVKNISTEILNQLVESGWECPDFDSSRLRII